MALHEQAINQYPWVEPSPELTESNIMAPTGDQNLIYQQIYREKHAQILNRIKSLGLSDCEAEDIVQEAFERLLKVDITDKTSYLRAYLSKIATNLAIDHLRRNKRSPVEVNKDAEIERAVTRELSPEEWASYESLILQVGQTLRELPDKCRTAFLLYKVKELEYREVATRLEISESMVRKHVLRAMRHCYERLKDQL